MKQRKLTNRQVRAVAFKVIAEDLRQNVGGEFLQDCVLAIGGDDLDYMATRRMVGKLAIELDRRAYTSDPKIAAGLNTITGVMSNCPDCGDASPTVPCAACQEWGV